MRWERDGRSRHARGYGYQWLKLRERVLRRDGGLCSACVRKGLVELATTVDHIVPKAKGGSDDLSNLQSLCESCHDDKTIEDAGHRVKRTIGADGWPV